MSDIKALKTFIERGAAAQDVVNALGAGPGGPQEAQARTSPDHTSGVMRCRYETVGGHVHCDVFGPYSGKAGKLIFRVEEWDHFQRTNPGWHFTDDVEAAT